jgi:hypothetical protein
MHCVIQTSCVICSENPLPLPHAVQVFLAGTHPKVLPAWGVAPAPEAEAWRQSITSTCTWAQMRDDPVWVFAVSTVHAALHLRMHAATPEFQSFSSLQNHSSTSPLSMLCELCLTLDCWEGNGGQKDSGDHNEPMHPVCHNCLAVSQLSLAMGTANARQ